MFSRRDLLKHAAQSGLLAGLTPLAGALVNTTVSTAKGSTRCINVVNFIRGVEPRFETDLLLPVQNQMKLLLEHKLPATWLLQFDALVSGPFVPFLKTHIAENHEVGIWLEMNEKHCAAAAVEWRGRSDYEWDSTPSVAFTIGYSPDERIALADTAMRQFHSIWGRYPTSVASWNLDSITMAHLSKQYGIDAYAVCRDQIATDGFTIWGAPIAGYYPSTVNCWSPALSQRNQIPTPIFRMLGQDPVYYYNNHYPVPGNRVISEPDTMEPVWTSGRSSTFVKEFLAMIAESPTLRFAYAQLGQENSFPWPDTAAAYPVQMQALAELRDRGAVQVETMGETGRRFKRAFPNTPPQAQVQLNDPFGNSNPPETSAWYQSRFYRANLHFRGDLPFLRDLTVYSDQNPQPFLTKATRDHEVSQRMPALVDGYHWSKTPGSLTNVGAGGFFHIDNKRAHLAGKPTVTERGDALIVEMPMQGGNTIQVRFEEQQIVCHSNAPLTLSFEWDPAKAPTISVDPQSVNYTWQNFKYAAKILRGEAKATKDGWEITGDRGEIRLHVAQPA